MNQSDPTPQKTPDSGEGNRSRDRAATEKRILDAAQKVLTETGASGLGVNALARAAGVDKQLIYRYYGGLDGVLQALGERIALWWQDRLLDDPPISPPATYAALIERLALRLLHVLRTEPLAAQSGLWELADTSGLVGPLTASRARALGEWMARTRGSLQPPEGVDAPAVNAILVSAISYMVLASRTSPTVVGLPLDGEAGWARVEAATRRLVRGVYGA
ncbi:MAG: hypothetical protein B7Z10_02875 [Rhodobacterales bacterium 32-66-7]|nr:MAG: hypothetical protein B7Z10_02875 [Rhodobacterales bacterium 32-66-7]